MTKKQWLNQTVMCDEWGRPPSLADVPMHYMSREKSFKKKRLNDTDIIELYKQFKETWNDN